MCAAVSGAADSAPAAACAESSVQAALPATCHSWVWGYVVHSKLPNGKDDPLHVICTKCRKQLERKLGNTSNIAAHLKKHNIFPPAPAPSATPQQTLSSYFTTPSQSKFLTEKAPDALMRLIASHNLPLRLVEAPELKELFELLRPGSACYIPSRPKLGSLITKTALAHQQQVEQTLEGFYHFSQSFLFGI